MLENFFIFSDCTLLTHITFLCARPRAWHGLSPPLHKLTYTSTCKHNLKAFLFDRFMPADWEKFYDEVIANCISPVFVFVSYRCLGF